MTVTIFGGDTLHGEGYLATGCALTFTVDRSRSTAASDSLENRAARGMLLPGPAPDTGPSAMGAGAGSASRGASEG